MNARDEELAKAAADVNPEITPEMMEAGAAVIRNAVEYCEPADMLAADVFMAMWKSSKRIDR